MKATHNIKINDVWYMAGDELPEEKAQEPAVTEPEAEPEKAEESKPRSTRRKKLSE